MKRILSIMMLLTVLFTFAACNNNKQYNPTNEENPTETNPSQQIEPTVIISDILDEEDGVYYKNNQWSKGILLDDVAGNQVAQYEDEWPELETGDLYVSDVFMYGYNMRFDGEQWTEDKTLNGWSVRYKSKEAAESALSYKMQTYINKEPVVCAAYALSDIALSKKASGVMLGKFTTDISNMLQGTKLKTNVYIIGEIIEKYDGAFDVQWDIKRKVEGGTIYECSKTIILKLSDMSVDKIIDIATSAKYLNVNMLLSDDYVGEPIIENPTTPS